MTWVKKRSKDLRLRLRDRIHRLLTKGGTRAILARISEVFDPLRHPHFASNPVQGNPCKSSVVFTTDGDLFRTFLAVLGTGR
jgi:hypothetical protein